MTDDEPTVQDELRALLRALDKIDRERTQVDARIRTARRRYADENREFVLPSLERLRRELL